MKSKYFVRLILFMLPLLLSVLFVAMVDPYEFINLSHVISSETKYSVLKRSDEVSPRGSILWNVVHYKRDPVNNILIGDSQGANIKEDLLEDLTGEPYFNFCVPGASYETMFDIFWLASKQTQLRKVYFQVAFMNFSAQRSYNIYHFASDYCHEPYKYFICRNILKDAYVNVLFSITKNEEIITNPYEYASLEFRNKKSIMSLDGFFDNYSYPEEYIVELSEIAQYCKTHNIDLNFVILPTYSGVFDYLEKHNLTGQFNRFKKVITNLGKTYDFHVNNQSADNRQNFIDYFHLKPYFLDEITWKVWGEENEKYINY